MEGNIENQNNEFWEQFKKPLALLKSSGKAGVKAVKGFVGMLALMAVSNVIFLIITLYRYFGGAAPAGSISWVLISFLIGIVCMAFAAYRGYQFLIIEVMHQVYRSMRGVFEKLSETIVEKTSTLMEKKDAVNQEEFSKEVNLVLLVREKYGKSPRLFKKGMVLLLGRVPLFPFVQAVQEEIASGRKEEASKKLHGSFDAFMEEEIFGKNSNQWMMVIFVINVLACMLIITYKLGA